MTDQPDTFRCPACTETYQPHWRAADCSGLCRTCAAERDDRCEFADHPQHLDQHPCSYGTEQPGDPCRYCAAPVPTPGPCPTCWLTFEGMAHADIKALLAADGIGLGVPYRAADDSTGDPK